MFGEEGCRLIKPWSPDYLLGRWSWWNWDSATVSAGKYAGAYDVVSVGNPWPPFVGAEQRAVVMRELIEAKVRGLRRYVILWFLTKILRLTYSSILDEEAEDSARNKTSSLAVK